MTQLCCLGVMNELSFVLFMNLKNSLNFNQNRIFYKKIGGIFPHRLSSVEYGDRVLCSDI